MATDTLIIACEVLRNQIEALEKMDHDIVFLEQGLHRSPQSLKQTLQETIENQPNYNVILLAYGLCSNAIIGLKARTSQTLVIPRIDDCIGISMGSRAKYYKEFKNNPGTYYFTKGWIEADSDPLQDYYACIPRLGQEVALWASQESIRHYTRACLIKTRDENIEEAKYVNHFADFFKLKYEEVEGSLNYIYQLFNGPWDDNFVVVKDGQEVSFNMFQSLE